jgi:sarcosine oxidase subunit beta
MTNFFDAIIIGAGVHGASLAYHLALRGVKPLVLEKSFVAAGATGRSSGLVRMHYDLEPEARLAYLSFSYFRDWSEKVGGQCGYTCTGFLQLVSADQVEALKANVAIQQRIGINTRLVTASEVQGLAPMLATDDVVLAAYEPESGYADPTLTASSLVRAAQAGGAVFMQDCRVTALQVSGGRVQGVVSSRGNFSAPVVVNAAGPWSNEICRMAGVDLPLGTWRHDVLFVKRPPQLKDPHLTVIDFPNLVYFRPEGLDLTLVALEDGNPLNESPHGNVNRARPGFVEAAIERICRRVPLMEHAHVHSDHSGYDSITPDQHPVLGPAGPDGFFLDTGFSGTGFKISPATGLCMSEWILDGKPSTVDLTIFSPARFAQGRQIRGEHAYHSIWR